MLGLLLTKVVIGIVAAGVVGGAAYGAYKLITKDSAKSEISEKVQDSVILKDAFKAIVKEKGDNSISVEMLDRMDEPLGKIDLTGDEISDDINIGDEIIL